MITTRSTSTPFPCGLAAPAYRPRVGDVVRDIEADTLAVGEIVHFSGLDAPVPGVPWIEPLRADQGHPWQAVPGALRPATADEVRRAERGEQ